MDATQMNEAPYFRVHTHPSHPSNKMMKVRALVLLISTKCTLLLSIFLVALLLGIAYYSNHNDYNQLIPSLPLALQQCTHLLSLICKSSMLSPPFLIFVLNVIIVAIAACSSSTTGKSSLHAHEKMKQALQWDIRSSNRLDTDITHYYINHIECSSSSSGGDVSSSVSLVDRYSRRIGWWEESKVDMEGGQEGGNSSSVGGCSGSNSVSSADRCIRENGRCKELKVTMERDQEGGSTSSSGIRSSSSVSLVDKCSRPNGWWTEAKMAMEGGEEGSNVSANKMTIDFDGNSSELQGKREKRKIIMKKNGLSKSKSCSSILITYNDDDDDGDDEQKEIKKKASFIRKCETFDSLHSTVGHDNDEEENGEEEEEEQSQEEFNRRVEDFIDRFNEQIRLQSLQSHNCYSLGPIECYDNDDI